MKPLAICCFLITTSALAYGKPSTANTLDSCALICTQHNRKSRRACKARCKTEPMAVVGALVGDGHSVTAELVANDPVQSCATVCQLRKPKDRPACEAECSKNPKLVVGAALGEGRLPESPDAGSPARS